MESLVNNNFWSGKKVFVTGHTGFKGSWLSIWLKMMGAKVVGYSLPPEEKTGIYSTVNVSKIIDQEYLADIRDENKVLEALKSSKAEIVFHLAAQSLVQRSYQDPISTYEINVVGLVKVLRACNTADMTKVVINVTSDKCYENFEWYWPYREDDRLGGYDPYSSSKACAELVSTAFDRSYFRNSNKLIATARAGNVIGGGDQADNRLLPDFFRALASGKNLSIRNPDSTRPWQHVLEPLSGYLLLAEKIFGSGQQYSGSWNFGPSPEGTKSVKEIIDILTCLTNFRNIVYTDKQTNHEANFLSLDSSKAKNILCWKSNWSVLEALEKTVEWFNCFQRKGDLHKLSMKQIEDYVQR